MRAVPLSGHRAHLVGDMRVSPCPEQRLKDARLGEDDGHVQGSAAETLHSVTHLQHGYARTHASTNKLLGTVHCAYIVHGITPGIKFSHIAPHRKQGVYMQLRSLETRLVPARWR